MNIHIACVDDFSSDLATAIPIVRSFSCSWKKFSLDVQVSGSHLMCTLNTLDLSEFWYEVKVKFMLSCDRWWQQQADDAAPTRASAPGTTPPTATAAAFQRRLPGLFQGLHLHSRAGAREVHPLAPECGQRKGGRDLRDPLGDLGRDVRRHRGPHLHPHGHESEQQRHLRRHRPPPGGDRRSARRGGQHESGGTFVPAPSSASHLLQGENVALVDFH